MNPNPSKPSPKGKYVSALVSFGLGELASITPKKRKRKPTLEELAQLIRGAHGPVLEYGNAARRAASIAIECAVICGGYLREAKAKLAHGHFRKWVKQACNIEPRTARNYMRLHIWVCTHQRDILEAKPRSLRQFYILAGILPEDETKKLPKSSNDDLAKLRRLVRKVTTEAAAHRNYEDADKLWQALKPLAPLLREVSTEIGKETN
jgi:hypothetical protein